MTKSILGIIGGSGIYDLPGLQNVREQRIESPWGEPSGALRRAVDELVQPWAGMKIDKVAGMEARGFILGGAVAHQVSAGFIPIRKKGKLPHKRVSIAYSLEYGLDEMEMHEDAVAKGERVILVDDLIATGGAAKLRQMDVPAALRRPAPPATLALPPALN